jgi:hypothetical protein
MTSTSVLSPPIPVERSQRWPIRTVAIVAVALLALVAFGIGRVVLDDGPAHRNPAPASITPQQVDPLGTMAQLNALLSTPEGQAALVREFGPGAFGAQPSTSTPASPASSPAPAQASTSDGPDCLYSGPC